jgi:hypothetical protein
MEIYRQDAIIELSSAEVSYLLGKTSPPPDLLLVEAEDRKGKFTVPFPDFKALVEYYAKELNYESERTVLVCDAESGDTLARYNEQGLVFDEAAPA